MRPRAALLLPVVIAVLVVAVGIGLALGDRRRTAETSPAGGPGATPTASVLVSPPAQATAVPDRVIIDGRAYRIEAYLWRDFMPITPPGGRPLAASIKVIAEDGRAFPQTITADRVWVYGPDVWDTAPSEVRRSPEGGTPVSQIEVVASDGPKWDPGTKVDVVIRLRSGTATYLVRQTGVTIERTS